MNEPLLPGDDHDLRLARRIGKLLDDKQLTPDSLAEDSFEETLSELKKAHRSTASYDVDAAVSNKMWAHIAEATRPAGADRPPLTRIFRLRPSLQGFAIAASFLILVAFGWYMLSRPAAPTLVAEAGPAPVSHLFADGSEITLRPHSKLFAVREDAQQVHVLLEGEGYFQVVDNPNRVFEVEAGPALITVLGTTFNIASWDTTTSVFLEEGRIQLTHTARNQEAVLTPGQSGGLSRHGDITIDNQAEARDHLDWLANETVFSSARLSDLIYELEFHFDVTIDIPPDLGSERVSGSIPLTDIQTVLEKVSFLLAVEGRFVQSGENMYRFEPI